jgi:hypothetical protein
MGNPYIEVHLKIPKPQGLIEIQDAGGLDSLPDKLQRRGVGRHGGFPHPCEQYYLPVPTVRQSGSGTRVIIQGYA